MTHAEWVCFLLGALFMVTPAIIFAGGCYDRMRDAKGDLEFRKQQAKTLEALAERVNRTAMGVATENARLRKVTGNIFRCPYCSKNYVTHKHYLGVDDEEDG